MLYLYRQNVLPVALLKEVVHGGGSMETLGYYQNKHIYTTLSMSTWVLFLKRWEDLVRTRASMMKEYKGREMEPSV